MNESHEITAWLGDAADDLTDEQRTEFERLITLHATEIIPRRPAHGTPDYHAADFQAEDTAAWVAAYELATDTFNLHARGQALLRARDDAQQGAIMAALAGHEEAPTARAAAVSRPWLRKQLGK